ncbi:MAG TPA: hypothetical protein VFD82_13465 [Planctomycetota bacterium]|nr:hypothetical protein [Planctomycetota bacterium]
MKAALCSLLASVRLIEGGALASLFLSQLCAQAPVPLRYSTHDWTRPILSPTTQDYREAFADVKSPGDGRTYAVGTIEVKHTGLNISMPIQAFFSDSACDPSSGLLPFDTIFAPRQVVVLQVTDSTNLFPPSPTHPIVWQRYFYGTNAPALPPFNPSNARGISVWPGSDAFDTRIAICGETYDQILPGSQAPTPGWATNTGNHAGGFIAVYRGNGDLLWSHHFFTDRGTLPEYNDGHCAITDVSIRVEAGNDIVTYCGISSFGNPSGPIDSLTPLRAFAAPTPTGTCLPPYSLTGGATDNGAGQWDGIVGRLSRPHDGSGTTTPVFHSIVGGSEQDGLFGIAEIDENVFVGVGSSGTPPSPTTLGPNTFPWTTPVCPAPGTAQGVVMVFNAPATGNPPTANLQLLTAQNLGSPGSPPTGHTVARDVFAIPRWKSGPVDQVLIVGSTNDPNLLTNLGITSSTFPYAGPQPAWGGQSDGFILAAQPTSAQLTFFSGTFRGGAGDEGITGVQGWNEFLDHFVVVGFGTPAGTPNFDLEAESYFIDTTGPFQLKRLTQTRVGGTGEDMPAAMGRLRATNPSVQPWAGQVFPRLPFNDYGLRDPAGGGIAVDQSARVNVVGTTASPDYPVSTRVRRVEPGLYSRRPSHLTMRCARFSTYCPLASAARMARAVSFPTRFPRPHRIRYRGSLAARRPSAHCRSMAGGSGSRSLSCGAC